MKTNKSIKAFIPYTINRDLYNWLRRAASRPVAAAAAITNFIARDPGDHEWSNLGLISPIYDEELDQYVHDLDGAAYLLKIQYSERKLPASVRDEEVGKRFRELSEKEGRPLSKKEYAQLKEDVESSLLPQAFIVRKFIPVFVTDKTLLVCTSSASMAEKILAHIVRLCESRKVKIEFGEKEPYKISPGALLTRLARETAVSVDDFSELEAGESAVFKGTDKRTIRVKDRDLSSEELRQVAVSDNYSATELSVTLRVDDEDVMTLTMTDRMIFKGIKLSDITWNAVSDGDTDDLHVTYWLYAKEMLRLLGVVTLALNEGEEVVVDDDGEL